MIGPNIARALLVLEARRGGKTLKQIAEQHGFTKQRARQIIDKGLEIEEQLTSDDPWFELNSRLRNALTADGCEPTLDGVRKRYAMVRYEWRTPDVPALSHITNIGVKSIAELQAWLVRHGKEPIP